MVRSFIDNKGNNMSIKRPNFGQYLTDIMEQGDYTTQAQAAKAIGISAPLFNMILKGKRLHPSWEVGAKIIREYVNVTDRG